MLLNKTEQLFHKDLLGTETKPAKHTLEEKEDNPANDTWQKNKGIPQINVWQAVQRENTEQKHSVNLCAKGLFPPNAKITSGFDDKPLQRDSKDPPSGFWRLGGLFTQCDKSDLINKLFNQERSKFEQHHLI